MDGARIWLAGLAAACLLLSFMVRPASSDELDTLLLVQEAQPLRDQWQECAAGFARNWLNSKLTAERLAETAFRNCRSREVATPDLHRKEDRSPEGGCRRPVDP